MGGPFDGILGHSQGGLWAINVLDAKEYGTEDERESFSCLKFGIQMNSVMPTGHLNQLELPACFSVGWTGMLGNRERADCSDLPNQQLSTPIWLGGGLRDPTGMTIEKQRKVLLYCRDAHLTEDPWGRHDGITFPPDELQNFMN